MLGNDCNGGSNFGASETCKHLANFWVVNFFFFAWNACSRHNLSRHHARAEVGV